MESSIVVVGTDATMVSDALRSAIEGALGGRDPSLALQDYTVKDVANSSGESVVSKILEALNTPAFLLDRRVVVVRDAQLMVADEVAALLSWMANPAPETVLVLGVVGAKSNKLVKAGASVIEVNVGSRSQDRVAFVRSKLAERRVTVDASTAQKIAEKVGDDIARVDSLARTLQAIYGTAPLTFTHVEPYLGDAGDVPEWDLTDAIDAGDATQAIKVARRMLDSKGRAALQIVNMLQRHYLRMVRLEGSGVRGEDEAATLLGINRYPAGKALRGAQRLGASRLAASVHMITNADVDLKGGVSYGGKNLDTDMDATELTVIEVLVARLAKLTQGARRR
ncbi:MAG: DNA polymerase III subunit delta [Acidimicrobiales bacterium]